MTQPVYPFQQPPRAIDLNAHVALAALPAVVMTGLQYGWMGLAVTGIFMASLGKMKEFVALLRQPPANPFDDLDFDDPVLIPHDDSIPFASDDDIQIMCDRLVERRGADPVTVRSNFKPVFNAHYRPASNTVIIPLSVIALTESDELGFILGHEIEHQFARAEKDISEYTFAAKLSVPLGVGLSATVGMAGIFMPWVGQINNLLQLGPIRGTLAMVAASAVSMYSWHRTTHAAQRAIEFHCDTNALRLTGNILAARSVTEKATLYTESASTSVPGWLTKCWSIMGATHPTTNERLRNLNLTWAIMQREAQQNNAAPAVRPDMP